MREFPNPDERFRYYDVKTVALADGYWLYRAPMTGELAITDATAARAALLCDRFASVRERRTHRPGGPRRLDKPA